MRLTNHALKHEVQGTRLVWNYWFVCLYWYKLVISLTFCLHNHWLLKAILSLCIHIHKAWKASKLYIAKSEWLSHNLFIRKIHNLLDICVFTELDYLVLIKNDYLAFGKCFYDFWNDRCLSKFSSFFNLLNIILPILNTHLALRKARGPSRTLCLDMFTSQQTLFNKMRY